MPYNEVVAERIRRLCLNNQDIVEKKMFGGLGFLLHGNMCVGVWQDSLIVRVGPEEYPAALKEPFAGEFDITGRPMRGWVMVAPQGFENIEQLAAWFERAREFVSTLPAK